MTSLIRQFEYATSPYTLSIVGFLYIDEMLFVEYKG